VGTDPETSLQPRDLLARANKLVQAHDTAVTSITARLMQIAEAAHFALDGESRIEVLAYLYWHCDPLVKTKDLCRILGCRPPELTALVRSFAPVLNCTRCEVPVRPVTSRAERSRIEIERRKGKTGGVLCPECDRENRQWSARWLERLQADQLAREAEIARLRSLPYAEYLVSDHWLAVRTIALREAYKRCQLCYSRKQLNVHHRTYERLGGEAQDDLIVLCRACHAKFHDKLPQRRS
jgi:5-methylcytosine-specific restriction endonuclease McrA